LESPGGKRIRDSGEELGPCNRLDVNFLALLAFLRPATVSSLYFFAVVVNVAALGFSSYETSKTLKRL
jgi:hypothetical protein